MKTNEFIQIVNATSYLSKQIKINDIVLQIDALRKLHVRLQTRLEYLLCDPISFENEIEREKIKSIAIEIREFANENTIQVNFIKLPIDYIEFSKQFRDEKKFASYYYENIEITNLIVFIEKRKQLKINKTIETIKQIDLTNETNEQIFDENGNDMNTIKHAPYL